MTEKKSEDSQNSKRKRAKRVPFLSESDYRLIDRAAAVWGIDERSAFRNAMRSYIAAGSLSAEKLRTGKEKRRVGSEAYVAALKAAERKAKASKAARARWNKKKSGT